MGMYDLFLCVEMEGLYHINQQLSELLACIFVGWWGDFSCHIGEKSGYELVFMGYGDNYSYFMLCYRYKLLQTFRPVLFWVFYCVVRLGKQYCEDRDMIAVFSILCIWCKPAQRKRWCLLLLVIFWTRYSFYHMQLCVEWGIKLISKIQENHVLLVPAGHMQYRINLITCFYRQSNP